MGFLGLKVLTGGTHPTCEESWEEGTAFEKYYTYFSDTNAGTSGKCYCFVGNSGQIMPRLNSVA